VQIYKIFIQSNQCFQKKAKSYFEELGSFRVSGFFNTHFQNKIRPLRGITKNKK